MKKILGILGLVFLSGCAGFSRGCSSEIATNFGGDWVVAQYTNRGESFNCWKLNNVSITNEPHSDGIYWKDDDGHLVHISGWYNRVQVSGNNFEQAAKSIGVELKYCKNGKYLLPQEEPSKNLELPEQVIAQ